MHAMGMWQPPSGLLVGSKVLRPNLVGLESPMHSHSLFWEYPPQRMESVLRVTHSLIWGDLIELELGHEGKLHVIFCFCFFAFLHLVCPDLFSPTAERVRGGPEVHKVPRHQGFTRFCEGEHGMLLGISPEPVFLRVWKTHIRGPCIVVKKGLLSFVSACPLEMPPKARTETRHLKVRYLGIH